MRPKDAPPIVAETMSPAPIPAAATINPGPINLESLNEPASFAYLSSTTDISTSCNNLESPDGIRKVSDSARPGMKKQGGVRDLALNYTDFAGWIGDLSGSILRYLWRYRAL
jgi:hypothetical protein